MSPAVVSLRPITDANREAVEALAVAPDQGRFVSGVRESILEAGVLRAFMLRGSNFLPLSSVGHSLAAYRALLFGWRTTPRGIWTDLYMWQQFLEHRGCGSRADPVRRSSTSLRPPARRAWTLADRLSELER
jgi:hypothetical protein